MPITITGGMTLGAMTLSPPANYSVQFNGTSQYLSFTNNTAFGSGSFTLETWLYPTATPSINAWIYGFRNGADTSPYLFFNSSRTPIFAGDITTYLTSSTALALNVWSHVAVVRSGTAMTMYINGTSVATATSSQNFSYTGTNNIGFANGANSYYYQGYISNFRIVIGTAVYTSAFTPSTLGPIPATQPANLYGNPSAAIASGTSLLTCQSSTIIDNSTNAVTITNNGGATVSPTVSPFP